MTERRVVKARWLELREPFEQVWSGKVDFIEVPGMLTKIRRLANLRGKSVVRIDIEDTERWK